MDSVNGCLCLIIIHGIDSFLTLRCPAFNAPPNSGRQVGEIEHLLSFFAKGVPSSLHGSDADARSDGGLKSLKINNYEMWKQNVKVSRLP